MDDDGYRENGLGNDNQGHGYLLTELPGKVCLITVILIAITRHNANADGNF